MPQDVPESSTRLLSVPLPSLLPRKPQVPTLRALTRLAPKLLAPALLLAACTAEPPPEPAPPPPLSTTPITGPETVPASPLPPPNAGSDAGPQETEAN